MKYKVSTWLNEGDSETTVLGVAESRLEARQLILDYAKTLVGGGHVAVVTYDLVHNSIVAAILCERITHIQEDWEGNWSLIWFDGPQLSDISYPNTVPENDYHDKFFFVFEEDE